MLWSKVQHVTHTVGGLRQDRPGSSAFALQPEASRPSNGISTSASCSTAAVPAILRSLAPKVSRRPAIRGYAYGPAPGAVTAAAR